MEGLEKMVGQVVDASPTILDGLCRLFPGITRNSIAKGETRASKELIKHLSKLDKWGRDYQIDPSIVEQMKALVVRCHGRASNLGSIVGHAAPFIEDGSKIEDISPHWCETFQDCAETVSDEDVRMLWAKILAGEANKPGRFSVRTLMTLRTMERSDIEAVVELAATTSFVDKGGKQIPYSIELRKDESGTDVSQEARRHEVVSKKSRYKLVDLGLVHELSWGSFTVQPFESITVTVGSERLVALNPTDMPIKCVPCHYRLTKVGVDLLSLCEKFGTRSNLVNIVTEVLSTWGFVVTKI